MLFARYLHSASELPNGKVIVAGSFGNFGNRAELYDPVVGTWTNADLMSSARGNHIATLLPNGRLMVAGGYNGSFTLSSTELYEPTTGTWSMSSAMNAARRNYTATFLPNGNVLIVGGLAAGANGYLSTAELYDPDVIDYNRITGELLIGNEMHLSYAGFAGKRYVMERTFNLSPANWQPLVTNTAGVDGTLFFTNTPNTATNQFWRIRHVPWF